MNVAERRYTWTDAATARGLIVSEQERHFTFYGTLGPVHISTEPAKVREVFELMAEFGDHDELKTVLARVAWKNNLWHFVNSGAKAVHWFDAQYAKYFESDVQSLGEWLAENGESL